MTTLQRLLACIPKHLHKTARALASAPDTVSALAVADLLDEHGHNALVTVPTRTVRVTNGTMTTHQHTVYVQVATEILRWRLYSQWQTEITRVIHEGFAKWPIAGSTYRMRQIPYLLRRLTGRLESPDKADLLAVGMHEGTFPFLFQFSAEACSLYSRWYGIGSQTFSARCISKPDGELFIRRRVRLLVDHTLLHQTDGKPRLAAAVAV